jgi:hypothetical protein
MDFVDTSAWFAYFLPTDPDHQRVRAGLRSARGPLVSTDYCVDETLTLLVARGASSCTSIMFCPGQKVVRQRTITLKPSACDAIWEKGTHLTSDGSNAESLLCDDS